jgi:hypothetical protein
MNRDFALTTMQAWRELVRDPALIEQAEGHFWRALTVLIPDSSPAAALDLDGEIKIVALAEHAVVELAYRADPATLVVTSRTIDPASVVVELTERLEQFGNQVMGGLARIRTWSFRIRADYTLAWETRQVVSGGFSNDRVVSAEECLARHVASAVGWELPTRDADGPDWE